MPLLTKDKWSRTRQPLTHTFQTNLAHVWCITWNYDSSVIFIILVKLWLMQLIQLWGFCYCGCHVSHVHMHAHTNTITSFFFSFNHVHSRQGPVDLWCVNKSFFFSLIKQGLRQTVFGANSSLCCALSCLLEHIFVWARAAPWTRHNLPPKKNKVCI